MKTLHLVLDWVPYPLIQHPHVSPIIPLPPSHIETILYNFLCLKCLESYEMYATKSEFSDCISKNCDWEKNDTFLFPNYNNLFYGIFSIL